MEAATTLRLARRRAGLSQCELAAAAGTSHTTLAAYEAARTVPTVDTLDRVLRAAGFATSIVREARADRTPDDRAAKGAELVEVLELAVDGQARLFWHRTPVDVFLNTTAFHEEVSTRVRWEPFHGADVPFLGCVDLAVFKAHHARTQDWADLEAMHAAGCLGLAAVSGVLAVHLGPGDRRIARLHEIAAR